MIVLDSSDFVPVALSCGSTSSENCTYLTQTASQSVANPCTYTICPVSSDICRIKLDFTVSPVHSKQKVLLFEICMLLWKSALLFIPSQTFSITGPYAGTATTTTAASTHGRKWGNPAIMTIDRPFIDTNIEINKQTMWQLLFGSGGSIGDCTTDTFTATTQSGASTAPLICGYNTGQHSKDKDLSGKRNAVRLGILKQEQFAICLVIPLLCHSHPSISLILDGEIQDIYGYSYAFFNWIAYFESNKSISATTNFFPSVTCRNFGLARWGCFSSDKI